jgi:hypothetical protein
MNQQTSVLIVVALAVVLIGLMAWGWVRRTRRDAQPLTGTRALPDGADVIAVHEGLYVATTRAGEPLQRIAAPGLRFRSRAAITVADAGVALDLPGQDRLVVPAERIDDVAQATVAIDRVVERDGLVRLTWRTDPGTTVDTYLRPQDVSAKTLADDIRTLITNHRTGSAA